MWKKHFRERLLEEEGHQLPPPPKKKKEPKNGDDDDSSDSEGLSAEPSPRYHIPRVSSRDLNFPAFLAREVSEDDLEWYKPNTTQHDTTHTPQRLTLPLFRRSLWNPPEHPDKYEMKSFLKLNCLLGKEPDETFTGKVWMVHTT